MGETSAPLAHCPPISPSPQRSQWPRRRCSFGCWAPRRSPARPPRPPGGPQSSCPSSPARSEAQSTGRSRRRESCAKPCHRRPATKPPKTAWTRPKQIPSEDPKARHRLRSSAPTSKQATRTRENRSDLLMVIMVDPRHPHRPRRRNRFKKWIQWLHVASVEHISLGRPAGRLPHAQAISRRKGRSCS